MCAIIWSDFCKDGGARILVRVPSKHLATYVAKSAMLVIAGRSRHLSNDVVF